MFLQICEKLNFPRECMIALESACRAIAETSRTSNAFSLACESLLDYLRRGNPMGAAHGIFFYGEDGIVT